MLAQTTELTVDQLKQVVPKGSKSVVTLDLVNKINSTVTDPVFREAYRENVLGYVAVLKDGKYKMEDYLNAVKYVSYKLMNDSNVNAWTKTFPDRYQRLVTKGSDGKEISAHVAMYNRNKLVNLIVEQTLVPSHILNQDLYQKALNVQADLMLHSNSDKVRCDAANSLLTQLKMPETKKIELDIGVSDSKVIEELKETTLELAAAQRKMVQAGATDLIGIAHSKIIEGEIEDS